MLELAKRPITIPTENKVNSRLSTQGQVISKCPFGVFKSSKKPKKKNSRISALVSKMRSNKKIRELYTAIIGGFYFGSPTLLFWFDLFLEARAEILEKIVGFLGDLKSPKGHFEINWPLSLL